MKVIYTTAFIIFSAAQFGCKKDAHPGTIMNPPSRELWTVSTVAGDGRPFFSDGAALMASFRDGPADQAIFNSIIDLVIDKDGNLFLTDDNRIREVSAQGSVTTIAGSTAGYSDGEGPIAKFSSPAGLTMDKNRNIFVAEVNNNRIRKISRQ